MCADMFAAYKEVFHLRKSILLLCPRIYGENSPEQTFGMCGVPGADRLGEAYEYSRPRVHRMHAERQMGRSEGGTPFISGASPTRGIPGEEQALAAPSQLGAFLRQYLPVQELLRRVRISFAHDSVKGPRVQKSLKEGRELVLSGISMPRSVMELERSNT